MFTFLAITTGVVFVLLVVVSSMRPMFHSTSVIELERRAKKGSKEAKMLLRREQLLPDVISLLRIVSALLLVAVVLLAVVTFGWVIGIIVAIVVALEYGAIAKFKPLVHQTTKLYLKLEPTLLSAAEKVPAVFMFIRNVPLENADDYHRFDSREELQELVASSEDVLSEEEKQLIVHALGFGEKRVDSVMTRRKDISSIKKSEFLGPLVLSELHDLGHSRLPVIGSDLNHVVGILHLRDLLSLDIKRSVTAEKAMEPKVHYIREDQTLEHALAAFLKTRHHLFIVINEDRETVGLLTLEDVLEAMIGRKILDEDDNHEDLRAMAAAKRADNNVPEDYTDV